MVQFRLQSELCFRFVSCCFSFSFFGFFFLLPVFVCIGRVLWGVLHACLCACVLYVVLVCSRMCAVFGDAVRCVLPTMDEFMGSRPCQLVRSFFCPSELAHGFARRVCRCMDFCGPTSIRHPGNRCLRFSKPARFECPKIGNREPPGWGMFFGAWFPY